MHSLTLEQKRRYARHFILEGIGEAGQQKLLQSRIGVIGAGGLGSAALSYLATAGVGQLTIIDSDRVDPTNLQRQILHEEGDIGRLKVESAADRLEELNSETQLTLHPTRLTAENAQTLLQSHDIVLDGSDNFATRHAVHRACYDLKIPLVSAAAISWKLQLSTFKAFLGDPHPCYACFVPEEPADARTCSETGVLGPLVGIAGSWQAAEAIKELLGVGSGLSGKILRIDLLTNTVAFSTLPRDPHCRICGAA